MRVIQSVLDVSESRRAKNIVNRHSMNESVWVWLVFYCARRHIFPLGACKYGSVDIAICYANFHQIQFNSMREIYSIWFPNVRKHKWQLCLHAKLAAEFNLMPVAVVMQ